ncbi:MAG TPA: phosphate/phosphite/phosphonate ABC transporter substrate-binding protein [Candidatus Omnitrophota bacterium]|nr:phosphate/phosphite/phosphonate ABC transporter substrate-binding protein [Candidatus Omnitrophota bacterium]
MTAIDRRSFLGFVLALGVAACDDQGAEDYRPTYTIKSATPAKTYRVGCPFNTPETLFAVYRPLIDYLNARLGGPVLELEASRDYESFEQKLYYRNFDFALANPYQTVMAVTNGFRIFAKMGDDHQNRGMILVRRDSGITRVADLRGKVVSYPASSALASALLPQDFLSRQGLDIGKDVDNRYVGSEESSILSVFLGRSAAATTWPLAWSRFQRDDPAKASQLEVKWQTESLPNGGWVARDDVPPDLVGRIAGLLLTLHESAEGRQLLDHMMVSRFEPADDATYAPVQDFLRRFNDTVRPVALP